MKVEFDIIPSIAGGIVCDKTDYYFTIGFVIICFTIGFKFKRRQ